MTILLPAATSTLLHFWWESCYAPTAVSQNEKEMRLC